MRFPRWRKMTWVFLIVNALFVLWITVGISDRGSKDCATDPSVVSGTLTESECIAASDVGTGIGVALVAILWFFVFVVLSLIWFMTRPKRRTCPVCGEDVKKGRTTCQNCGHDFAAAARSASPPVAALAASGAVAAAGVALRRRERQFGGSSGTPRRLSR